MIGQGIYNYCEMIGLSKDHCSNWTSLSLILLSIILTGVGLYPKIAKWGGAGALVPITGFANSVAAPAIEYKKRRAGIRDWLQDLYHIRTCHSLWNLHQFSSGTFILDLDAVLKEEVRLLIRNLTSLLYLASFPHRTDRPFDTSTYNSFCSTSRSQFLFNCLPIK